MRKNPYGTRGQQLLVPETGTFEQGREGCIGAGQQGQAGRDLIGSSLPLLPCVLGSEVVATGSEP